MHTNYIFPISFFGSKGNTVNRELLTIILTTNNRNISNCKYFYDFAGGRWFAYLIAGFEIIWVYDQSTNCNTFIIVTTQHNRLSLGFVDHEMVSFEVNLEIYEFIIFSLPFPKTLNGFFLCTCHTSQDIKYKKMLRILNENWNIQI